MAGGRTLAAQVHRVTKNSYVLVKNSMGATLLSAAHTCLSLYEVVTIILSASIMGGGGLWGPGSATWVIVSLVVAGFVLHIVDLIVLHVSMVKVPKDKLLHVGHIRSLTDEIVKLPLAAVTLAELIFHYIMTHTIHILLMVMFLMINSNAPNTDINEMGSNPTELYWNNRWFTANTVYTFMIMLRMASVVRHIANLTTLRLNDTFLPEKEEAAVNELMAESDTLPMNGTAARAGPVIYQTATRGAGIMPSSVPYQRR